MRLWHLMGLIFLVAVIFTLGRDPVGLVAMIVFVVGVGETILGTTAVMALFQTLGALGFAKTLPAHAEALAATAVVLVVATLVMCSLLFVGIWVIQVVVV